MWRGFEPHLHGRGILTMKNSVHATLIPIGTDEKEGKEWLVFSVFLTPLISDQPMKAAP